MRSNLFRTWFPYVLLAGTVLVLGFNWPLLAIGLRSISPLWLVSLRLLGSAIVVFAVVGASGRLRTAPRSDLPVVLSVAFGRLAAVMVLVFIALRFVPPGRSSVLVWTASLWTVPMAATFLDEHMTRQRWIGLITGLLGILLLVEPWGSAPDPSLLLGYGLLLVAAIFHAATSVHIRRHVWAATPLELLPWQILTAAIPVTVSTIVLEGLPSIAWTPVLVGIVIYQGALATGFATWAQLTVLQRLPAVPTNMTLMLVPVVGLVSSALVVGDQLTAGSIGGTSLILVGVLVGAVRGRDVRVGSVLE